MSGHRPAASSPAPEVTALLLAWREGDAQALDRLLPIVLDELRRMARRQLRHERANHTLQPTALVHEVFIRLVDVRQIRWQDRSHFLAMSARLMRRVLVDAARSRGYQKRGAGDSPVQADLDRFMASQKAPDIIALDSALEALETEDPRKAQVVQLRFFGGLSIEETAEALSTSVATVVRDWKLARTWLLRELRREKGAA